MAVKGFVLRCVLNAKENVFRDVRVSGAMSLLELHQFLNEAFSIQEGEMASFYVPEGDWNPVTEIPMLDFEGSGTPTMDSSSVDDFFYNPGDRLIWISDLINLRSFFIEVVRLENEEIKFSEVLVKFGEIDDAQSSEVDMENEDFSEEDDEDNDWDESLDEI
jgi:hypothetical protein